MRVLFLAAALLMSELLAAQLYTKPAQALSHGVRTNGSASKSAAAEGVVRVFVLAGQSNMQGQGKIYDGATGAVGVVVASFVPLCDGTETCAFTFNMMDGFGDASRNE